LPAIGAKRASSLDTILDEEMQARRRSIRNHPHADPSNTRPVHLCGYDDDERIFNASHETRLLRMLVDGHNLKTAAAELGMTRAGVAWHMRNIYEKRWARRCVPDSPAELRKIPIHLDGDVSAGLAYHSGSL
jgi:DNA-binding NarL/FixJ family response regulator